MSDWNELARRIAYWTLPPGIYASLAKTRRYLAHWSTEDTTALARNAEFRGRHSGERIFILGCGPSIKEQNLAVLEGELCISVASFFRHPECRTIRPRYHCVAPLHPPFTEAEGVRWFQQMETSMANTTFFLGITDKSLVDKNQLFTTHDVRYLGFSASWTDLKGDIDLARPVPPAQSVSIMALLLGLYLGCKQIYLVGMDHTFTNPDGKYEYRHFYPDDGNALRAEPPPSDFETQFTCQAALWRQYKVLRSWAQRHEVMIFNATAGGLLDVFPRVELESACEARI